MQQTERSKTEWDQFRAFEAEKHGWFLSRYSKLGMRVIEDIFDDTKTNDYDVVVEYHGKLLKIDEKARRSDFGDILVEIWQDASSKNKGWISKDIDGVFYASWSNPEAFEPSSAYLINMKDLQEIMSHVDHALKEIVSTKGFGRSVNKAIDPAGLLNLGVATKII